MTDLPGAGAREECAPSGAAPERAQAGGGRPVGKTTSRKSVLVSQQRQPADACCLLPPPRSPSSFPGRLQESLKNRVDGASSKAAASDAASDAGSLGESALTERQLADGPSSAPCPDADATPPFSWRGLLSFCGSGLLMSVAYLVRKPSCWVLQGPSLPPSLHGGCSSAALRCSALAPAWGP